MATFTTTESFRKAGLFRKGTKLNALPYQDPTYLGFLLLFQWKSVDSLGKDHSISSPLFDPDGAQRYLERLAASNPAKYDPKLQALLNFKKSLEKINKDMPWYWQTLAGVDKLQAYNINNPYVGGDDSQIAIGCLESVNLAITGLMRLYRQAAFDEESWSWVLPANLRKFSVKIYVSEIRSLYNEVSSSIATGSSNNLGNVNQSQIDPNVSDQPELPKYDANLDLVGENKKPYLAFQLTNCEWDLKTGVGSISELSNAAPEAATNSIAFNYERIFSVEFKGMNGIISDEIVQALGAQAPADPEVQVAKTLGDKLKERAANDMKAFSEKKKEEIKTTAVGIARDATGIPFTMDGMKPKIELEGIYMNAVNALDKNTTSFLNVTALEAASSLLGNVYVGPGNTIQQALDSALVKSLGNIYKD